MKRRIASVIFVVVLGAVSANGSGIREVISLNGKWEHAIVDVLDYPEKLNWT